MTAANAGSTWIRSIERPHPRLLTYYLITSLVAGPGFPFLLAYRLARYHTLRYRFDEDGVSMSWGALFHREVYLTYSRIQDIHLASGIVERYLGLARIQIQTASGKAAAEMTLEGLLEFERVRDFLYTRMHGSDDDADRELPAGAPGWGASPAELVRALEEVAAALDEVRGRLGEGPAGG